MGNLKKYSCVLKIGVSESFEYRFNFFVQVFLWYFPLAIQLILWKALYIGSENGVVAGYVWKNVLSYYICVMIISELSKTEGIEWSVISDIRDGGLQKYILRPINYIVYQFVYVLSKKIVVLICIGINIIPMIILFHQYLDFNNIFIRCVFFGVATFGALLMVYLFNVSIALLSFWFTEFTAIFHFLPFGVAFLNGTLLPLDIMPSWLFNVLSFTPFYYMIYFPAQVLNGQIVGLDCLTNFIGMIMVLGVEGLIVTVVWNCGIKKFSAIGG